MNKYQKALVFLEKGSTVDAVAGSMSLSLCFHLLLSELNEPELKCQYEKQLVGLP